jgi:hypothetical protein
MYHCHVGHLALVRRALEIHQERCAAHSVAKRSNGSHIEAHDASRGKVGGRDGTQFHDPCVRGGARGVRQCSPRVQLLACCGRRNLRRRGISEQIASCPRSLLTEPGSTYYDRHWQANDGRRAAANADEGPSCRTQDSSPHCAQDAPCGASEGFLICLGWFSICLGRFVVRSNCPSRCTDCVPHGASASFLIGLGSTIAGRSTATCGNDQSHKRDSRTRRTVLTTSGMCHIEPAPPDW